MTPQVALALVVGLAASIEDFSKRTVSNWIPVLALVGGIGILTLERGWRGAGSSLLGAAAGFGVFLVFYVLGGMGGGDVKLMAGFGAVLGWERMIEAALWTAGCGGLMALGVIAWSGVRRLWTKGGPTQGKTVNSIPYAPAITLGAWLSLVPKV